MDKDDVAEIMTACVELENGKSDKVKACKALCYFVAKKSDNRILAAAAIAPLSRLLSKNSSEVQEYAALALAEIVLNNDANKIAAWGAIRPLRIMATINRHPNVRAAANFALVAMDDCAWQIAAICTDLEQGSSDVQYSASMKLVDVIGGLSVNQALAVSAIAPLIRILEQPTCPRLIGAAAWALGNLINKQAANQAAAGHAIATLDRLLEPDYASSMGNHAVFALVNLVMNNAVNQATAAAGPTISHLIRFLENDNATIDAQRNAAMALSYIVDKNDGYRTSARFAIEPLTRLLAQAGCTELTFALLYALGTIVQHNNVNQRAAESAIPLIVGLLEVKNDPKVKNQALLTMMTVVANNVTNQFAAQPAIPYLTHILEIGDIEHLHDDAEKLQKNAACVLGLIVKGIEDSKVFARMAIVHLMKIMDRDDTCNELKIAAAFALGHIVDNNEINQGVASTRAISIVAKMILHNNDDQTKVQGTATFIQLLRKNSTNKAAAWQSIGLLVGLLERDNCEIVQMNTAHALSILFSDNARNRSIGGAAIMPLTRLLEHPNRLIQFIAVLALSNLVFKTPDNEADAWPAISSLTRMMASAISKPEEKSAAAIALSRLVRTNVTNRTIASSSIPHLVSMLQHSTPEAQESAALALSYVVIGNEANRIAAGGAMEILRKLRRDLCRTPQTRAYAAMALDYLVPRELNPPATPYR